MTTLARLQHPLSILRRVSTLVATVAALIATFGVADAAAEVPEARAALAAGDCGKAGEIINAGLARDDAQAYFLAGWLYDQGTCVAPDAARAARLYRQAIALGDGDAPTFLGLQYALGRGLPQDYALAHRVYARDASASTGPESAETAAASAEAIALGYDETITRLARRNVEYPITANRAGVEATIDVVLSPGSGRIVFENVRVGVEVGSNLPRTLDFTNRIETAYRDAIAKAPRPALPPDAEMSTVTVWRFAMRRTFGDRKVPLEGYVTVGEPRVRREPATPSSQGTTS